MAVMFIRRDEGDPEELERSYSENHSKKAGEHGRGEDWGIPLVVLHHLIGYTGTGRVVVDMFEDQTTMETLLFSPQELPEHLRPATVGMVLPKERWERDGVFLKVHKMVPPLRAVATEEGGARRPRY